MKNVKYLFLFVIICLLTGCMKYNITMDIKKDKTMDLSIISAVISSSDEENLLDDETIKKYKEKGFTAENYSKDGTKGIKLTKKIKNIDSISSTNEVEYDLSKIMDDDLEKEKIFMVKKGFIKNKYKAKIKVENSSNYDDYDEDLYTDSGMELNLNITLPFSAISSNATTTSNDNHNLSWNLLKDNIAEFEFELYNNHFYIIVISLLVIVIIGIILIIISLGVLKKFKKDKNNTTINNEQINYSNNIIAEKKDSLKLYKLTILILLMLLLIILVIILVVPPKSENYVNTNANTNNNSKNEKKDLAKVFNASPPSWDLYETTAYNFIYNNKIYYYKLEHNSGYTDLYDRLYVMNLDGTDNKILAESEELRYAYFYFAYNNEAYYYTIYDNDNKKIDLNTGKITSLKNNDNYIPKTYNNGTIDCLMDHAIANDAYTIYKRVNINTNETLFEIKTDYSVAGYPYFLDYDNNNIYYIEDYYSKVPTLYKNNETIISLDAELEFLATTRDYVYLHDSNRIHKINVNTKELEKQFSYNIKDIKRISSGNNQNYYYSNNKIYFFDTSKEEFILLIDNVNNQPTDVYEKNNRLYFMENIDNLKYNTSENNLGSVLIYNISNKKIESSITDIRKLSFDEKNMYVYIESNNEIKTIKL